MRHNVGYSIGGVPIPSTESIIPIEDKKIETPKKTEPSKGSTKIKEN